jgi:hypothetical protein
MAGMACTATVLKEVGLDEDADAVIAHVRPRSRFKRRAAGVAVARPAMTAVTVDDAGVG